jgi:hypothetical protein
MARTATRTRKSKVRGDTTATLVGGATVLAVTAAVAGAFLMRRQIQELAVGATDEALSAGHSVGVFGNRAGKSLRREMKHVDLERLLAYTGLKRRPSLVSRLLPPVGIVAAVIAAGGAALWVLAPKLRAAGDGAFAPEGGWAAPTSSTGRGAEASTFAPHSNGTISDPGEAVSHASR